MMQRGAKMIIKRTVLLNVNCVSPRSRKGMLLKFWHKYHIKSGEASKNCDCLQWSI